MAHLLILLFMMNMSCAERLKRTRDKDDSFFVSECRRCAPSKTVRESREGGETPHPVFFFFFRLRRAHERRRIPRAEKNTSAWP